jgi:hypothetical protein
LRERRELAEQAEEELLDAFDKATRRRAPGGRGPLRQGPRTTEADARAQRLPVDHVADGSRGPHTRAKLDELIERRARSIAENGDGLES